MQTRLDKTMKFTFISSFLAAFLIPPDFSIEAALGINVGVLPFSSMCQVTKSCMLSVSTYFAVMLFLSIPALVVAYRENREGFMVTKENLVKGVLVMPIAWTMLFYALYVTRIDPLSRYRSSGQSLFEWMLGGKLGLALIGGALMFCVITLLYISLIFLPRGWYRYSKTR